MRFKFLQGHEWEPSPVFEREACEVEQAVEPLPVVDPLREALPWPDEAPSSGRHTNGTHLDAGTGSGPAAGPPGAPDDPPLSERAARESARHLGRYFAGLRALKEDGAPGDPGDLYLVDETPAMVREILGFRMRGHPLALLGAFVFPRHRRSSDPHGRASLAPYLSNPPRTVGYAGAPTPPGLMSIYLPGARDTIPGFMKRLRRGEGTGIHVDPNVIDVAFDLRFTNPSEIRQHSHTVARPGRSVFRTTAGHVISGTSVGLYYTLHKSDRFIILTDAVQHRLTGDVPLPTLAVNRSILALQRPLDGSPEDPLSTLAFHPATASMEHFLGWPYDDV